MADYLALAAQLKATRQAEQQSRAAQASQGGAATSSGGVIGSGGSNGVFGPTGGFAQPQNQQQNQQQQNPLQTGLDAYNKYKDASKLFGSGAQAFSGATPATMSAMGTGGGSSLGSMGLMSSAPAVSYPGAAAVGSGATGAGAGGAGATGGAGGLGAGGAGAGGMMAALAALGYLGDKEMNESKGSMINADKINNMFTIGDSGIGFRGGDLVNGFNPATWLSDPMKAGKGLVNVFTLGFLDKWL